MKLATFHYEGSKGWSQVLPKDMDSDQTLILAFADPSYFEHSKPLNDLCTQFPKSLVMGCSTAGEIHGKSVSENSISVAIAHFENTQLRVASAPISTSGESRKVGEDLAKQLNGDLLKGVFVLSDGLSVNGSELLEGFGSTLKSSVVIGGGLAGDGTQFKRTWVLHERRPKTGYISAVGFYGARVRMAAGSLGGWDVFGPERRVTKSQGNILYELDGKPALALYKKYLGPRASELPSSALLFPLSLRSDELERKGLVRTVLSVDETANSMTFAGDIPEGSRAQLMKANFSRLIEGAAGAARLVSKHSPSMTDNLAIAVSCVGRRLVLGQQTENETEATLKELPKGTQQVGFYSYGEISPLANGKCDLHNQTMTLTTITEE